MQTLNDQQLRVLGGAARYVSHRDGLTVASACEALRKQPALLSDIVLELQALGESLRTSSADPSIDASVDAKAPSGKDAQS